jgi:serine/threonine protein kinase
VRLELLPGTVLDQKYRIEKQLGKGAMGAVFQATHLGTMRPVALKVVAPKLAGNPEFVQRFKREAEAAGRLSHPNVVNVTDFGVTQVEERDLAYLVMEYLDGQTLADYLLVNVRPTFNFLLDVMDQTGLALDAAHAAGIVHRDLKPSNIWLEPNHRGGCNVKVLDFGIAKLVNPAVQNRAIATDAVETLMMARPEADATVAMDAAGMEKLLATPSHLKTTFGTLLGTPAYMAPEQCSGFDTDLRADVYSLAVIAYQMLCGRLPFEGETLGQLIKQQIQSAPQSPREHDGTVPEALAGVVLSGLEKDPGRRPPTAGTFATRLRAASEGELGLLRQSKDLFNTQIGPFMAVLLVCLSVVVVGIVPIRWAAGWAAHSKLAPDGVLVAMLGGCLSLLLLFAFQLYKAAGMLILKHASETGQFRSAGGLALRALGAGLGDLLRTQLLSAIDLRPSSWRGNILWPVVWAAEGLSGKAAIARSRQLCATLPGASLALVVRQYAPALVGPLAIPSWMALLDSTGSLLHFALKEVLAGSPLGWMCLLEPILFGIMFARNGQAFSLLYWSALRCRHEGTEITLPAASRDDRRKPARGVRPGTLLGVVLPAVMLALIVARYNVSAAVEAMNDASSDGRRTALLKLIDGGLGVEQRLPGKETALFDAVRGGDERLVAELLKRGAKVNVANRDGTTPLLQAAETGRNELARMLLDRGASVDVSDRDGRTPLMVAAMRGNLALAQLLLERGALAVRMDTNGKTAAAYAAEEGYGELAGLLSRK